jgi:hypothetical protein
VEREGRKNEKRKWRKRKEKGIQWLSPGGAEQMTGWS